MISHEHKCIFVHLPKCAGETIETAFLGKPLNKDDDEFRGSKEKHDSIFQIKKKHPEEFDKYYKFAVVRNIWDQFVSFVAYCDRRYDRSSGTFQSRMRSDLKSKFYHVHSASNMLTIDGRLAVDRIVRFEALAVDLEKVAESLGMEKITLGHVNRSKHQHYSAVYDYYCMLFIKLAFAEEIKLFGHTFEGDFSKPPMLERLLCHIKVRFDLLKFRAGWLRDTLLRKLKSPR